MSDRFLTVQEVAALLKKSPGAVRQMVSRRQLPYRKRKGLGLRFLASEIEKWVDRGDGVRLEDLKG